MARPRLCGLWLGVSAGGRSWSLLASSIVLRRALSAPARSVRVSHDSDPASGREPYAKPLPNPESQTDALRHIRSMNRPH